MKASILIAAVVMCSHASWAQQPRTIKLSELEEIISSNDGSVRVINFWATWCAPCIKELPYFEKVSSGASPDVRVVLVSMDLDLDPDPTKVYKFVKRKGLQSEVLLLDASDPNTYIEKIDRSWSGALPATLIVNQRNGKRLFVERSLKEGELEKLINDVK